MPVDNWTRSLIILLRKLPYNLSHNRHDFLKQTTARSFMTYYITYTFGAQRGAIYRIYEINRERL
jgi:hypothetical protein